MLIILRFLLGFALGLNLLVSSYAGESVNTAGIAAERPEHNLRTFFNALNCKNPVFIDREDGSDWLGYCIVTSEEFQSIGIKLRKNSRELHTPEMQQYNIGAWSWYVLDSDTVETHTTDNVAIKRVLAEATLTQALEKTNKFFVLIGEDRKSTIAISAKQVRPKKKASEVSLKLRKTSALYSSICVREDGYFLVPKLPNTNQIQVVYRGEVKQGEIVNLPPSLESKNYSLIRTLLENCIPAPVARVVPEKSSLYYLIGFPNSVYANIEPLEYEVDTVVDLAVNDTRYKNVTLPAIDSTGRVFGFFNKGSFLSLGDDQNKEFLTHIGVMQTETMLERRLIIQSIALVIVD
jgi:hypothetical protein